MTFLSGPLTQTALCVAAVAFAAAQLPSAASNLRFVSSTPTSPGVVVAWVGSPQSAEINSAFATPLKAAVRDSSGVPLRGITVTFRAPSSGASAGFSGSATATAVTDNSGMATAPPATANGTAGSFVVVASVAGLTGTAAFNLTNDPVSTGSGWTNVTPAGWNPSPDYPTSQSNFGFQQVVVDPVRPSDFYAFTGYQGVWKSSDYGVTWTMVSTGTNSDAVRSGRNWAAAIDPNPNRNPATPPTLYTNAGYSTIGKMGIWKSIDGGVNWSQTWNTVFASNGTTNITTQVWNDMQGIAIDPNNSQHLLAVNHGNTQGGAYDYHIFESTNGGQTWIDRGAPAGATYCAVSFVTSTTWIATAEGWGSGSKGTFVTNNSGASWTNVGQMGKAHGNVQVIYLTPTGTVYLAAMEGIFRASSPYLSWTRVDTETTQNIIGTPSFLYASYGWSTMGTAEPKLRRASLATGTPWVATYTSTPSAMTNGAMGAAVSYNQTTGKYVIVTANRRAGLWRYVE